MKAGTILGHIERRDGLDQSYCSNECLIQTKPLQSHEWIYVQW